MAQEKRRQGVRLLFLFLYVGILFLINRLAFGQWIPVGGTKGLWFYAGIASIILGNLLVTPFYTKPVDALSYSLFAGIGIYFVNDLENWGMVDRIVFWIALGFVCAVLLASLIAIATKDTKNEWGRKVSETCMVLADYCGNHRVIFSVVFLFTLIVFHRGVAREMFLLSFAWAGIVLIEPDKHIWNLVSKIRSIWNKDWLDNEVGVISAYQTPRMILIRQHEDASTDFGTILAYKDSHASTKVGIVLNYVGRDETLLLRAIDIKVPKEVQDEAIKALKKSGKNTVVHFNYFDEHKDNIKNIRELNQLGEIIGIVDQDTTIERMQFEVINEKDITEGRLVGVEIHGQPVIYQVLDGLTKEDIVIQKNKYGYARGTAVKIGCWNNDEKKFEPANWLPNINSPVYLKKAVKAEIDSDTIGHFPKTNYGVYIKNINEIVTHNTAILGILGIGKSFLALELIERMVAAKIKVIIIDITNEYAQKLDKYYDIEIDKAFFQELQNVGREGKRKVSKNVEEGGAMKSFKELVNRDLAQFLDEANPSMVKIYNPAEFEVWRQDSKPYQDTASMASLSPTEVTQIISEETLKIVQPRGITEEARVCIVYEEAHTLIPEFTALVMEGDKTATNGTARAILQGRKFGLGCIVISQRTANVTKTILNQCNTVFAMRTFDDTGKGFFG